MAITVTIQPYITDLTVESTSTVVKAAVSLPTVAAVGISIQPTGSITSSTLQGALDELGAKQFQQASEPSGAGIDEGDIWYNTATDEFLVYRETSAEVFDWVPIMVGNESDTSDTIDAGSY